MKSFSLNNRFLHELPADTKMDNKRRQVFEACYSFVKPRVPSQPRLIHVSKEMLDTLGITEAQSKEQWFLDVMSGKAIYPSTRPYAMCYGGHQFGQWAGQLGDGRAINLFTINQDKQQWTLQLKGAGETPYSRSADGLAVLRSSIREHLCSEAMHHLGVPTTRSLSLVVTGDEVLRDIMYDGNPAYEPGAVVCRVAPSFLRFGNYQIFASRRDKKTLQRLIDYTIQHHFPEIKSTGKTAVIEFFKAVSEQTLAMILHWQRVGFVHGVMNTDNMSILGLTIDYGPYGWLEDFNPNWTPNTTDRDGKRYRFGWQPKIAQWNLMQLANTFYYLIEEAEALEEILNQFAIDYQKQHTMMVSEKLGLITQKGGEQQLIDQLFQLLYDSEMDYTIFFRSISSVQFDETAILERASYKEQLSDDLLKKWAHWFQDYNERGKQEEQRVEDRVEIMRQTNPKYVLRNYMAQLAIEAAENKDYSLISEFYTLLKQPYEEQPENEKWFAKRPEWAKHKVGSSMLSCSS